MTTTARRLPRWRFERSGDDAAVPRGHGGHRLPRTGALPEAKATFGDELWDGLLERDDWATADLWGLAEDTGWYDLLAEAAAARGL